MKKTTLIFIEDGSFTYDNRVVREAKTLVNNGWHVIVISPKGENDPYVRFYNANLVVYFYPKPTTTSYLGHIFEALATLTFGTILTFYIKLRYYFNIFHACNPMDILWLIVLPYKLIGVRFIFDQHDIVPELIQARAHSKISNIIYKIMLIFERFSYKLADVVLCPNESYKEIAQKRGGKKYNEVYIMRNGPEVDSYNNNLPIKISNNKCSTLVGYIGNMNPQDGVNILLDAANLIITKYGRKDIKFILIGGGSALPHLCEQIKKLKLENYITFTGRKQYTEALSILSTCDICVQPDPLNTYNDKSTMHKALDYMLLKKPVVAFDLKETKFSCGNAALYVRPNDVNDFADKIVYLADNPEIRAKMGNIGRERIEKYLSWQYSASTLLVAYEYALRKNV